MKTSICVFVVALLILSVNGFLFVKKSNEMPHEENEQAEIHVQVKELRRNPDLNVAALGELERLQLNKEDSTE